MRHNSEWLGALKAEDIIRLAAKTTVARMLERDDFCLRYKAEKPISVHEFLYPIFQAYDSVMVKADVEIGGTDQRFNFLLAREFQREMNQPPQIIMVRPLIPGTDGEKKMSKSLGNYVALNDPPEEKFGKIMSLPDHLICLYLLLLTDTPEPEIATLETEMASGKLNPRDVKIRLAQDIITWLHGKDEADAALTRWNKIFVSQELQLTDEILAEITQTLPKERAGEKLWLSSLLVELGLAKTKSEARRLVEGGGVYIGEDKTTDPQQEVTLSEGLFLRVGKRRMARISFTG